MSIFRRIMLGGGIDIAFLPETRKLYYKATAKVSPKSGALGSQIIENSWDSATGEGIIVCSKDILIIGDSAFSSIISLTSVTIPESVTEIGKDAFRNCSSLKSVYCKATTSPSLGNTTVFYGPASDIKIYVPTESVEAYRIAWGWSVYSHIIEGYDFEKGEIDIPSIEIWYTSSDGNIVEPNKTNVFEANITSNTFTDGKGIITFDRNVKKIGGFAFQYCSNLTSVVIPDSVTTIEEHAFQCCYGLISVNIPDSVTSIGQYAFQYCSDLTSVNIPNSVTTIGKSTFGYCTNLTSITISNSVTSIENQTFLNCSNLISVNIPDGVTSIKAGAFHDCVSLTSVTIPENVTSIGYQAFFGCSSLISIFCKATTPPSLDGDIVFGGNSSGRKIYVPMESVDTYKSAQYWSEYADAIEGYEF